MAPYVHSSPSRVLPASRVPALPDLAFAPGGQPIFTYRVHADVTDPNGEKAFYGNPLSYQGGRMSQDFTGGYGPEEFSLNKAKPGKYKVEAQFYGHRQQVVTGATTLMLTLSTKFGTAQQQSKAVTLRLPGRGEVDLGRAVKLLRQGGYTGYLSFEWEKKWDPALEEPEVAFPAYLALFWLVSTPFRQGLWVGILFMVVENVAALAKGNVDRKSTRLNSSHRT